jgi:hypothetical protein
LAGEISGCCLAPAGGRQSSDNNLKEDRATVQFVIAKRVRESHRSLDRERYGILSDTPAVVAKLSRAVGAKIFRFAAPQSRTFIDF